MVDACTSKVHSAQAPSACGVQCSTERLVKLKALSIVKPLLPNFKALDGWFRGFFRLMMIVTVATLKLKGCGQMHPSYYVGASALG